MLVAAAVVPGADHQQASQLPLGAGIGLERHSGKARDRRQPALQVGQQAPVTGGLSLGGKGMERRKGRPAHGRQFGRPIELHRATAERDHGVHQRKVAAHQALDIAQQLGFAAVVVEHGLAQPGPLAPRHGRRPEGLLGGCRCAGPLQLGLNLREEVARPRAGLARAGQGGEQALELGPVAELIEADPEGLGLGQPVWGAANR